MLFGVGLFALASIQVPSKFQDNRVLGISWYNYDKEQLRENSPVEGHAFGYEGLHVIISVICVLSLSLSLSIYIYIYIYMYMYI